MAKARRKKPVTSAGAGFEGRRELVTERVEEPSAVVAEVTRKRFVTVTRNVRHDPIEQLYHQRNRKGRRLISAGEREAGMRVRQLVEALGLDAIKTIMLDGTGGGGARCEIADHRLAAGQTMARLRGFLGVAMTALLVRVAGYGETITMCAADFDEDPDGAINGACSKGAREGTGFMLRQALAGAAEFFGTGDTAKGGARGRSVAWMERGARPGVRESYVENRENSANARAGVSGRS